MRVWILADDEGNGISIAGVFATAELALARRPDAKWEILTDADGDRCYYVGDPEFPRMSIFAVDVIE